MSDLNLTRLTAAVRKGGAALVRKENLEPLGGFDVLVSPPTYSGGKYNYTARTVDGETSAAVILDSKQSQLGRLEKAISNAPVGSVLNMIPRIAVTAPKSDKNPFEKRFTDIELPHRVYDGHIQLAKTSDDQGKSVYMTSHPKYIALRNTAVSGAWELLNTAPTSLVFGAWDSARKGGVQTRILSAITGDTYGVLSDQRGGFYSETKRNYARTDPFGPQYIPGEKVIKELYPLRADDPKAVPSKAKNKDSAAAIGVGNLIGETKDLGLAGVCLSKIVRTTILSLSTIRLLNFGDEVNSRADKDDALTAIRALLAAYALVARTYADQNITLRAGCELIATSPSHWELVLEDGTVEQFDNLTVSEAESLLSEALKAAEKFGVSWVGQVFDSEINEKIGTPVSDDSESS